MKTYQFFIILFLLLNVSLNIYCIGQKESGLIIPSDSSMVFKAETEKFLSLKLGQKLLDLIFYEQSKTTKSISGKQLLEIYLKNHLCINLSDLDRIYIFTSSFNLYSLNYEIGAYIELKNMAFDSAINCIKEKTELAESIYNNHTYYFIKGNGIELYISCQKKGFLISNNKHSMVKMLNVIAGNDDVSKNENLFKLIRLYSNNMIYTAGYLKQNNQIFLPPPFNAIIWFGCAIDIADSIKADFTMRTENPEKAEEILDILNGYINFFIMITETKNEEAGKMLRAFYDSLDIKTSGASLLLEAVLYEEDIDNIFLLMPIMGNTINQ